MKKEEFISKGLKEGWGFRCDGKFYWKEAHQIAPTKIRYWKEGEPPEFVEYVIENHWCFVK